MDDGSGEGLMTGLPTFDPGFSTPAMTMIWTPTARIAAMLDVERAIAASQADSGEIPIDAFDKISTAIDAVVEQLDTAIAEQILIDGWHVGTPVIPLLETIRAKQELPLLHLHVTTQDIVDSATMVQIGRALRILVALADRAIVMVASARDADGGKHPVMARTLLQPALPMTVAQRAQHWIEPLVRHRAALSEAVARLPLQLGGPIGDRTGISDGVVAGVARRLALADVGYVWHTDRSPISEVVGVVGRAVAWVAKIAHDVALLGQPEIGEVQVRAGGSSAMAHKRNPIDAVRTLGAADACAGLASIVTRSRPHEFERAAGAWHAEWFAVPLVFHTAAAAFDALGSMELRFTHRGP